MTAAELVAKQNRQLRLDRLVQADRRANRRDFDLRYGNHHHRPYGIVKRSTYKRQPKRETIGQAIEHAVGWSLVFVAVVVCVAVWR